MTIEGPALEELKRRAKAQIRRRMRALRSAIPAAALAARSERIFDRLVTREEVKRARHIASFWPMPDRHEVDLRAFDAWARARGANLYYPRMPRPPESEAGFVRVDDPADLEEAGNGFLEPPLAAPLVSNGEIDLVVVPALAVSELGYRVGFGAGFYDRVLPLFCPPASSIVVAYGFELLAELPTADHDFRCDVVVTDATTLDQRSADSALAAHDRHKP